MAPFNREVSSALESKLAPLADAVVARQMARMPELARRYGAAGQQKCAQDARYHLMYLAQAMWLANSALFTDYVAWVGDLLEARRIPREHLITHLRCMAEAMEEMLPKEMSAAVCDFIDTALLQLPPSPAEPVSAIADSEPLAGLAKKYLELLLNGDRRGASRLVLDSSASGTEVKDIYLYVFQSCQYEIGRLWQMNKLTVAQEHYCTAATQVIMAQFYPHIFSSVKSGYRFVAASVAGELHELGPRMVCDFLELAGWDTHYLGANTPADGILQMVLERDPHVLGLSATLGFHVREIEQMIAAVRSTDRCSSLKIIVGGAPFNKQRDLWRQIGADGSALNAAEAVRVAATLVNP
ncbi:MAG: cobalamin B12-binding domain-containing protein [Candidatus Binatia bacterium]